MLLFFLGLNVYAKPIFLVDASGQSILCEYYSAEFIEGETDTIRLKSDVNGQSCAVSNTGNPNPGLPVPIAPK